MSAASSSAAKSTSDSRKSDRRSSIRKKHTNIEKERVIEKFENACGDLNVAEWVRKMNGGRECEKHLGKSKTEWQK